MPRAVLCPLCRSLPRCDRLCLNFRCPVRINCLLCTLQRRVEREKTTKQVFGYQAYCLLHILPKYALSRIVCTWLLTPHYPCFYPPLDFLFSILQSHGVIKGTAMWTATNVSDGLSALCTCVEMVIFSIYMGWAYSWSD